MLRIKTLVPLTITRFKKTKPGLFRKPIDQNKKTSQERALEHYDDFYKSVFGAKWPGIRAALLTEHKYAAIVNNFGDAEETKKLIEFNGAVNLRDVFETFKPDSFEAEQTINSSPSIEKRLDAHLQSTESEEIRTIYQKHAEEELEKIQMEKSLEPSRTIDVEDVVDYKKSLQQSLTEDSEYDFDRMISAEIGVLGLQEFIPATKLKGMEDFVLESDHYRYYDTNVEFPLNFEAEDSFQYPKALDIFIYPKYDISRFSRPKKSSTGVSTHFLLDGASILPPLLLGVNVNDIVLDACSAPGGKSLTLLQTLLPEQVVCNDVSMGRCKRINQFFGQFLPDFETAWSGSKVNVRCADVLAIDEFAKYDKILVDVPCTNDRLSCNVHENNMFKANRVKERIQLPEEQSAILTHCLRLLKPGGSLVYSTCSLSPIQNDGVVNMALRKGYHEHNMTFTIKDLSPVLKPMHKLFQLMPVSEMKFGQLVLPYLPANFGPMYICKIQRVK